MFGGVNICTRNLFITIKTEKRVHGVKYSYLRAFEHSMSGFSDFANSASVTVCQKQNSAKEIPQMTQYHCIPKNITPRPPKYYSRFKNVSSYLYFADEATAVCCSDAMHEQHGEGGCCRYPYWHRSDIIQSQSGQSLLQWSAMASLAFQLRNSPLKNAGEIIQMRKKMPVQTVKRPFCTSAKTA